MRVIIILLFALISVGTSFAQNVGIGTSVPDPSAILELYSTDKGLLIPRMGEPQRDAIVAPANALMIFNTDKGCLQIYNQALTTWTSLCQLLPDGITNGDLLMWTGTDWTPLKIKNPGDHLVINSLGEPVWEPQVTAGIKPTVSTGVASAIFANYAQITANNVLTGNSELVISRGVCYGLSSNPTVDNDLQVNGSGLGNYLVSIGGLLPNTVYYARAFATSSYGTGYGAEISFTTMDGIPTGLTTNAASSIEATTADASIIYATDGGATGSQFGVCVSASTMPTTADLTFSSGWVNPATSTNFSITGLAPNTTYYVRSFLVNSTGTHYGNEVSFTTQSGVIVSNTYPATNITSTNARVSGEIISLNGTNVSSSLSFGPFRGICFGTSPNPTVSVNKVSLTYIPSSTLIYYAYIGSGNSHSGYTDPPLVPNTTYYCRAYATSVLGITYYGNEISFTTLP
jgi:hypothetical protein